MFEPAPCFLFFNALLIAIVIPTIVRVISFSFYRFMFHTVFSNNLRESNKENKHEPMQKTINSENFCYY